MVDKIVAHSHRVLSIAAEYGWMVGARYTNLRDVKKFEQVHFVDIDWKNYDFDSHIAAVKECKPKYTVAKDWEIEEELDLVLSQAAQLGQYSENVIIVPKVVARKEELQELIPDQYMFGFSVPTKYGGTEIEPEYFGNRPVHLLGGRPEVQKELSNQMNVQSLDCNRFTFDARFGDYFDGEIFRPHPEGGYERCIEDSIRNINKLWL